MLGASISINLDALRHNISTLQAAAGDRRIIWMVKCNAYGHGSDVVAPLLPSADDLGVASWDEAATLIEKGIAPQRLVIMRGFLDAGECDKICEAGVQSVIHDVYQLELLKNCSKKNILSGAWLKVDTGMHRLGVDPDSFDSVYAALCDLGEDHFPVRVMTHIACADEPNSKSVLAQLACFDRVTSKSLVDRSVLNSAGTAQYIETVSSDYLRLGLAIYAASPLSTPHPLMDSLKPVMRFSAPIVAIKAVAKGESIGYGDTWTAESDVLIALCAVGYGDGYPREVTAAEVMCHGERCSVVGRVSMDLLAVDVTQLKAIQIADRVELWGDEMPIAEVAKAAGTVPYTLLTRISERVHRTVIGDNDGSK